MVALPGAKRFASSAVAFVALALIAAYVDLAWLNDPLSHHLEPFAGGHGHPRLREICRALFEVTSPIPSIALGVGGALLLWQREMSRAARGWTVALALGFVAEIGTKLLVREPGSAGYHMFDLHLDSSFPSGHTLRAVILAGMATTLWPSHRNWFVGAVALTAVLLQLTGWHLPVDILGGLVGGLALSALAMRYQGSTGAEAPVASGSAD